jgi:hypothetical protein
MQSITFTLRDELPADQHEAVLARVRQVAGVERAQSFSPQSKTAAMRRLCYAQVSDAADVGEVMRQVAALPGVRTVEIPPERHLM